MTRYTKKIPEYVYFVIQNDEWVMGPYVNPKPYEKNIKFKLTEVIEESKNEDGQDDNK